MKVKRLISLCMAIIMLVSLFSTDVMSVYASDGNENARISDESGESTDEAEVTEDSEASVDQVYCEDESSSNNETMEDTSNNMTEMSSDNDAVVEDEASDSQDETEEAVSISQNELEDGLDEVLKVNDKSADNKIDSAKPSKSMLMSAPRSMTLTATPTVDLSRASLDVYVANRDEKTDKVTKKDGSYANYKYSGFTPTPRYNDVILFVVPTDASDITWYRDGEEVGNGDALIDEYLLQADDIGSVISVMFEINNTYYYLATGPVEKAQPSATFSRTEYISDTEMNYKVDRKCQYSLVEAGAKPTYSSKDIAFLDSDNSGVWKLKNLIPNKKYDVYIRCIGDKCYEAYEEKRSYMSSCSHEDIDNQPWTKETYNTGITRHYRKCPLCGNQVGSAHEPFDDNSDGRCDKCGLYMNGQTLVLIEGQENYSAQYTGKQIKPSVTVYNGDILLKQGTDYTVSYKNNTKVAKSDADNAPEVIITGKGNFEGKILNDGKPWTFTIEPRNINGIHVDNVYVTDSNQFDKNGFKVVVDGVTLKENVDYTVAVVDQNGAEAGLGNNYFNECKITGKGNYTGTISNVYKYATEKKSFNSQKVTIPDQHYTGSAITPTTMIVNGKEVSLTSDMIKSITNNKGDVNKTVTATAVIEYCDTEYKGIKTVNFKIVPNNLKDAVVTNVEDWVYCPISGQDTFEKNSESIKITYNGTELTTADYQLAYSDRKIGKVKITITPKAESIYTGKKEVTFNYKQYEVTEAKTKPATSEKRIDVKIGTAEYSKSGAKPKVTLTMYSGYFINANPHKQLKEGTDYTLSYKNNASTEKKGTVTINFKGNYKGTLTREFDITTKSIASITVSDLTGTYNANEVKNSPNPKVIVDGTTLVKGKDYIITDKDGNAITSFAGGVNEIYVTGMGNYKDTSPAFNYTLTYNLKDVKLSAAIPAQTYNNGTPVEPNVTFTIGNSTLVKDTDYKITYSNNVNVGTAKIKLEGVDGKSTGSKEFTFRIAPINVENNSKYVIERDSTISYSPNAKNNTLYEYKLVWDSEQEKYLVPGVDFTVSYKNNSSIGKATATISFKGNYTGKSTVTYDISRRKIGVNYSLSGENTTYNYPAAYLGGNDFAYVSGTSGKIKVNPKVVVDGVTLKYGTDYYISESPFYREEDFNKYKSGYYVNDRNDCIREYFYIVGLGNYKGADSTDSYVEYVFYLRTKDFISIDKLSIDKIPDQYYTLNGSASFEPIEIIPAIYSGKKQLKTTDGLKFTYMNNYGNRDEVTTATVLITAAPEGPYAGSKVVTFKILPNNLKNVKLKTAIPNQQYTGSENKPAIELLYNGETVSPAYYNIEYINNTEIGTAKVKITSSSLFTGSKEFTFKIVQYDAANDTDKRIRINDGKSVSIPWNNGKSKKPEPKVEVKNALGEYIVLTKGTDYTLSYANTTNAASATDSNVKLRPTVNINFKGKYKGTYKYYYTIVPESLGYVNVIIPDKQYTPGKVDSAVQNNITVINPKNGQQLTFNKDYKVSYYMAYDRNGEWKELHSLEDSDLRDGADVCAYIELMGNYKFGGFQYYMPTYHVSANNISSAKVDVTTKMYTGKEIKLTDEDLKLYDKSGNKLEKGEDYQIVSNSYTNNINKGTASVTVRGIGKYMGERKITFKITAKK